MEQWKDIKGYEGIYQISTTGKVKSLTRPVVNKLGVSTIVKGRSTSFIVHQKGYLKVQLNKNAICKGFFLHRLIALTFIPNPENKPQVNHINGIKTDNRIVNLEWCTGSENVRHAFDIGLCKIKGMPGLLNPMAKKIIDTTNGEIMCKVDAYKSGNFNFSFTQFRRMLDGERENKTNFLILNT